MGQLDNENAIGDGAVARAPYGIRVNAIGPGSIMTEILHAVAPDRDAKRRLLARTPLGRIGEPEM